MSGRFSQSPRVSDPDMHHGTCVTHVPWCMPGSLTSSFLWSRWRGKRSRNSRRMRKQQLYVSGKKPILWIEINYQYPQFHGSLDNPPLQLGHAWLIATFWHFISSLCQVCKRKLYHNQKKKRFIKGIKGIFSMSDLIIAFEWILSLYI